MKKDLLANLYQKCLILCSKILLNMLHYLSLTILFPWQHTGFQTSPILKSFLATFCVQFSYLQMVPDIHVCTWSNKHINMFNSSPIDELGNWCLKCWQGACVLQAKGREVSITTQEPPRNHPCKQLPTGTITLNQISGKILIWPLILTTRLGTSEGEGGVGTPVAAPLQIDLWRSAWIRKDLLKQKLNDPVRSARIHKDSQQGQQLINKGSYKPWLVICNDQHNQAIRKHASKEPHQRRGGAKPLGPPRIITHVLWGYPLTPQNTTRN